MPSRRQPRRLVGRRGLFEPGWTWIEVVPPAAKGSALRSVYALILLALALLGSLVFVLDSGGRPPATAAPRPHPATQFRLFQWSDSNATWQFGNLNPQNSDYHEGEGVPFMLRIDNANPNSTYTFDIRYDCSHLGINGYDLLSRYDRDRGTAPALAEDAPGNTNFNAALPVPDDPSIPFDNGETDRNFKLWGGAFAGAARGPSPATLCEPDQGQKAEKLYTLSVTAAAPNVFLLWSGHLASALDWGQGQGAASINGAPYHMKLDVPGPGVGERDRSIMIEAAAAAATATPASTPTATPAAIASPTPSPPPSPTPKPATPTPAATAGPGATATPSALGGGPTTTPAALATAASPTATPAPGLPSGGAGYLDPGRAWLWLVLVAVGLLLASPPAAYFAWLCWRAGRPY